MTRRPDPAPTLELLHVCWRFVAPSKRILMCGIYRTDAGIEVRAGYDDNDLLYSRGRLDIDSARDTAEELRKAVVAKGGFTEVVSTDNS